MESLEDQIKDMRRYNNGGRWSARDIAWFLAMDEQVVSSKVITKDDFPEPAVHINGEPRWRKLHALEWTLSKTEKDKPTKLYRHFDGDGNLLYIGISLSAINRTVEHRDSSPWFDQIARIDIETHPSRRAAMAAERKAIQKEDPAYNIVHKRLRHA